MTDTYPDDAPIEVKTLEEIRCLRCVLERILRVMDEGLFVDYEMEKFRNAMEIPEEGEESHLVYCPSCGTNYSSDENPNCSRCGVKMLPHRESSVPNPFPCPEVGTCKDKDELDCDGHGTAGVAPDHPCRIWAKHHHDALVEAGEDPYTIAKWDGDGNVTYHDREPEERK